jgi:ankyrin repeat protein
MHEDSVPLGSAKDDSQPIPATPYYAKGKMTLEAAIRAGDLAAATDLVRSGVDVNRFTPEGLTPLMIASGLGQSQMVDLLLTAGAQVLAVEPRAGATALHKAALSGNPDVVGLLLDHGAFIDQQSPILGHTALMDAVVYKHEDVVRLLLKRGARTTIRNHWHETALDIARRDGLDTVARLIETRNKTNDDEVRAQTLVPAIKAGDLAEVERLIAAGAAVNERLPMVGSPDDDYTPLAIAAREGNADIVRVLLEAGANPRRVIGLFLGTALHEACYFGYADVVRAMTDKRERVVTQASELDAQGAYNGMTPLHDAVWHGHLEAAQTLVNAGARLDLTTHAGLTPRELALLYGYDDLARFLAEAERE